MCDDGKLSEIFDGKLSEILVRVGELETDNRELRSQNRLVIALLSDILDFL